MRWSPSTGSSFQPTVYVALWVGKAWLVPHEVARLGDAGSIPEDDALIATDGLHISLAYLGELRDGDFEKIKLFADMFTKHIQYNGAWPIQDCTNRWQYEYERRFPIRIRTVLGTCKPERCKECHHFKTRCPEALPGENAFDTHLHARERTLWHLAGLHADFYRSHGVFKLELHSPLHRICRGMQVRGPQISGKSANLQQNLCHKPRGSGEEEISEFSKFEGHLVHISAKSANLQQNLCNKPRGSGEEEISGFPVYESN